MLSLQRTRALFAPCVAGVALLCCTPSPAGAQSAPAPSSSASPLPEIGRVTTSDRQDEPAAATARVTYVVTKTDMLEHGDDTIASSLERVPGVFIQRLGGPGAAAEVSIRGTRSDGVLVLLDGRPIAGLGIGVIDLGSLPTTGIERIEVVEGSGATLYGNDASGGVINIITSGNSAAYKVPVVSVAGGSYGYGRAALETGNFSFSREIAANNYGSPFLPPGTTRFNGDLSSTAARYSDAGTYGDLRISGSAGFVSRMLGVPGSTTMGLTIGARQQDDQQDARLSFELTHPQSTTTLDLSGSRETVTFLDPLAPEFGPTLDFSTDARAQASLRNNVVGGSNRLIYGADLANGAARNDGGGGIFAATPYSQTALYAQDNVAFGGGSSLYAGVRAERDGGAGGAVSPSLGGIVGLGSDFALRLNAGTAFRVPTAEDLQFPGFSNPFLQPERLQSFDATLDAGRVLGGATFGWFVQTGNDLIEVNPFADFSMPLGPGNEPVINAPQSSIAGFAFTLASQPYAGFGARFNATDTYRALQYGNGMPATRLPYRPVLSGSLDLGYTAPPGSTLASAGAIARSVGAMNGNAGDYTTIDAYVRLRLAPYALLSLRVYDVGNKYYEEVDGYPMPGRAFVVELSTR
jgi:outer membrane cobalamin receptor